MKAGKERMPNEMTKQTSYEWNMGGSVVILV